MRIVVVTTCSAEGWAVYGRKMLDSFKAFWDKSIELVIYTDGFEIEHDVNITARKFPPWFDAWKFSLFDNADAHGMANDKYNFRRDCVRFSHKVVALTDYALSFRGEDLLIWMDSDITTHDNVTPEWIATLTNKKSYMSWLNRDKLYPECGFLIFNSKHPRHDDYMMTLRDLYLFKDIFVLNQTHDSYVFEYLANKFVEQGYIRQPFSLSGHGSRHHDVFSHSLLANYMVHAKGRRKHATR